MSVASEILAQLAEPFPSDQVSWKPQSISKDKSKALAVAFIDARDVAERLDQVVGGDWGFTWDPIEDHAEGRRVVRGMLTVAGITRSDVGEYMPGDYDRMDPWKSAVSDCLKRCAALFGVGRYLYRLDAEWVDYDDQRRRMTRIPTLPDWARPAGERGKRPAENKRAPEAAAPKAASAAPAAPSPRPASVMSDAEQRAFKAKAEFTCRQKGQKYSDELAETALGCPPAQWTGSVDDAIAKLTAKLAEAK